MESGEHRGFKLVPGHPELDSSIKLANALIESAYSKNALTSILKEGGNLAFEQVFCKMPKILFHEKTSMQAYTPKKANPRSIYIYQKFQKRLKYIFNIPKLATEFRTLSMFLAIVIFHEFAHVLICWKKKQYSPNSMKSGYVTSDGQVCPGDAGYFLERLYFSEVVELIERKSVHINDLNQPKYVCICIFRIRYLLEFDENEIMAAVENQTIPDQFAFEKIHHMQEDEQSVHRGEDEKQDNILEPNKPYILKEGESVMKRFCIRAYEHGLEEEAHFSKILESEAKI
jgi:hypothetical protein